MGPNVIRRKIIKIDEENCDGCGLCIPACPEQAIQIVDGTARLVKDFYCDGLGACLGACPTGALTIEEREADAYDEEATITHIKKTAPQMLDTHLRHLEDQAREAPERYAHSVPRGIAACPSAATIHWNTGPETGDAEIPSALARWPVQLALIDTRAPYFRGSDLILVADCVPFAYGSFHHDFLKGKAVVCACPKLDDLGFYGEKLTDLLRQSEIRGFEVINMEVPCCFGFWKAAQEAVAASGKEIPLRQTIVGIKGERK